MVTFLLLPCFVEISEFNANSVDPDQTPRLYSLPNMWMGSGWGEGTLNL